MGKSRGAGGRAAGRARHCHKMPTSPHRAVARDDGPATSTGRDSRIVTIAEASAPRRAIRDTECCCCLASSTIVAVSGITFVLGGAVCVLGVILQSETSDWGVGSIEVFGWYCAVSGAMLLCLSLLGVVAARSASTTLLFAYFLALMLLHLAAVVSCVYAFFENDRLTDYLRAHWNTTITNAGLDGLGGMVGGGDQHLSVDEATELARTYFVALAGVGLGAAMMLALALVATARMLGLRAIANCLLLTLGLLGICAPAATPPCPAPACSTRLLRTRASAIRASSARAPPPSAPQRIRRPLARRRPRARLFA
jgi:hypothetical protein